MIVTSLSSLFIVFPDLIISLDLSPLLSLSAVSDALRGLEPRDALFPQFIDGFFVVLEIPSS
jgi:hypothetical protein